jgi:hypothetical protein
MDPFFQQLVSTPARPSMVGRSAVARVVRFDTKEQFEYENTTRVLVPDAPTMTAVEPYFYSNGTIPEIAPFCPSTDCAWPSFETLAVCSACEDVTELLEFGCKNEVGDWRDDTNGLRNRSNPGMACGYFLNATGEKPVLMSGYAISPNDSAPGKALLAHHLRLMDFVDKPWGGSVRFKQTKDVLFDWIVAAAPDVDSVYANKTPTATECVLHWCVKTISATYKDGKYSEKVDSAFSNSSGKSVFQDWSNIIEDGELVHMNYTSDIVVTPPNQETSFSVSRVAHAQTWILLRQYVPGHFTQENSTATPQLEFWALENGQNSLKEVTVQESPWMPPKNVSLHVERMANAMSQVMRRYENTTEQVPGSGSFETYIRIRWAWFSFPLVLLLLTLGFLIMTIWKGRSREDIGVWKTSSLATLVNGLDSTTRQHLGSSWKMLDVFEKASDIHVSLKPRNDGCIFVATDTHH